MKSAAGIVFVLMLVSGQAMGSLNYAINPNFELDAAGNVSLVEREYTDCLGWTRGAEWGQVRPADSWGDDHPIAQMQGRLAWGHPANIYQNTGHIARANEVYTLTADFKSDWCWQMDMKLHALDASGAIENTVNIFHTMNNHSNWIEYALTLDTAAHPEFVGKELRIEFQMRDWDSGQMYVTNVQLVPEPATLAVIGLGGLLAIRRRRPAIR